MSHCTPHRTGLPPARAAWLAALLAAAFACVSCSTMPPEATPVPPPQAAQTIPTAADTSSDSDMFQFGARSLRIPRPQGFVPISAIAPDFVRTTQASVDNRIVEIYATPDDAKTLAGGKVPFARFFMVTVNRKFDGVATSQSQFQDIGKQTTSDKTVAYRREPWGVFFSLKIPLNAGHTLATSGAGLLVKQQVLTLLVQDFDTNGQQWTQQALSAWADAVHKANSNTSIEQ